MSIISASQTYPYLMYCASGNYVWATSSPFQFTDENGTGWTAAAFGFSMGDSSGGSLTTIDNSGYTYGFTISAGNNTCVFTPTYASYYGPPGTAATSDWTEGPYNYQNSPNGSIITSPSWSINDDTGPSFSNTCGSFSYVSLFYFNIGTISGQTTFPTFGYTACSSFSGLGTNSTTGASSPNATILQSNTAISSPTDWMLFYQTIPDITLGFTCPVEGDNCDVSISTNSLVPIIGNIGFPFYDINVSSVKARFMYFQVIFALPYWGGEALSNCLYTPTSTVSQSFGNYPQVPAYVLAFYNRSYPVCSVNDTPYIPVTVSTDNCVLSQSPYESTGGYGNYFPIIYESTNFAQQSTGVLTENQTLLGFLNTTLGTSYTSLFDLLTDDNQNWLEGINNSTGVDFGTVNSGTSNSVNLGSGWYFAGFLPYSATIGSSTDTWCATASDLWYLSNNVGKTCEFSGGNMILATTAPLVDVSGTMVPNPYNAADTSGTVTQIGNYFWDTVITNYNSEINTSTWTLDVTYTGSGYIDDVSGSTYVPFVTYSKGDSYNNGYQSTTVLVYQNPWINTIEFYIYYKSGDNGAHFAADSPNNAVSAFILLQNYSIVLQNPLNFNFGLGVTLTGPSSDGPYIVQTNAGASCGQGSSSCTIYMNPSFCINSSGDSTTLTDCSDYGNGFGLQLYTYATLYDTEKRGWFFGVLEPV